MDRKPAPGQGQSTIDVEAAMFNIVAKGEVRIPPYPAVALKLGEIVRRADYGVADLISVVQADQTLAADILRSANAAIYGRGEVTSLQQAVQRIGAEEVVRLAVVSGLAGATRTPGALASLKRQVWQESVASAVICQALARKRGLPPADAFLCGLLHDFGWVLGLTCAEEIVAKNPSVAAQPAEWWNAILAKMHVDLGLIMAAKWKLPAVFADVISLHHQAQTGSFVHAAVLDVIQAADAIVLLMRDRPHVSAKDLEAIPFVRPAEREVMAATLPNIPQMVGAFEAEPVGRAPPSKVAPGESALREVRTISLPARQVGPKVRGPFALSGIASLGWVMSGKEALPENQLIEVELGTKPPLRLWAKAARCTPAAGGFEIECRPFALNGAVLEQWNELVLSTPASAPA